MSTINTDQLLQAISPDSPCGEDLSYDPDYMELDRLAQGTPEQQMGDEVVGGEEPNWKEIRDRCIALFSRTRDLRVAVYLAVALMETEKLSGLEDGLCVLRRLIEEHWDHVHPILDTEDDNPSLERVNIISSLSPYTDTPQDPMKFIPRLMNTPLTSSQRLGYFSLRDVLVASGELQGGGDEENQPPPMAEIEAAFTDTSTEDLQASRNSATGAFDHVKAINDLLVERAGAHNAPDLSRFMETLQQVGKRLDVYLAKRGYESSTSGEGAMENAGGSVEQGAASAAALSGEIRTTQDVLRALEKICQYYDNNEPSSPVPLLVRRAQKLVGKSFVDIIRDISPDAVQQVENVGGLNGGETG